MTPWCDLLSAVLCAGGLSVPVNLPADFVVSPAPATVAQAGISDPRLLAPLPIVPIDTVPLFGLPDGQGFAAPQHAAALATIHGAVSPVAAPRAVERMTSGVMIRDAADNELARAFAVLAAVLLVVRRRLAWFNTRHLGPRASVLPALRGRAHPDADGTP